MRRTALISAALLAVGLMAAPSSAAGTVTIGGSNRSGTILTVTGGSTYTDQPYVNVGDDAAGDIPGQDVLGGDLIKAELASLANGGLGLRWSVAQLPPQLNGAPGLVYGWTLCVNESTCYEVDAARFNTLAASQNTYGNVWSCADPACTPASQTLINETILPTFDPATKTITMKVTASLLGLSGGANITPTSLATTGPAFVAHGDLSAATYTYNNGDGVPSIEEFTLAAKQVSVAVGAPGQDPATVTYATTVTPAANGGYSAGVDVSGLTGAQTIYARACLGDGNCGYATLDITL